MLFVYRFESTEDPQLLANALWHHKVAHQIVANQGVQELWLLDPSQQATVQQLISIWKEDPSLLQKSTIRPEENPKHQTTRPPLSTQMRAAPLTLILLLMSVLVSVITELGSNLAVVSWFTISPFQVVNGHLYFRTLSDVLSSGQWWRVFTPALLHFSMMHIVFNSLWVWEIGRKLEYLLGKWVWLFCILVTAVASNLLQYYFSGYPVFGGLSGVVYGLIGFAWLLPILLPRFPVMVNRTLMAFFMIWLAFGYTSLPEAIGLGRIANTAHTIGLLSGLVLCVCFYFISTLITNKGHTPRS
ncbi:rhomboid family intramembrane serine protease [Marinomonas sp. THO17]|uniref:rhomboid family intramembrane serine protease n=1 Tax=Marinomonas sp. THO17 TaxID=3149048 RepID=UPI00336BC17A